MAEDQLGKRLMSFLIRFPLFPVGEDFGASSHVLFDPLILPGKEFTDRPAVDRLIRQRRLQGWFAGEIFIPADLGSFVWAVDAKQKSHFLL